MLVHESYPGARALTELNGLLTFHHRLLQEVSGFPTPPLEKTAWNSKVRQLELFDPTGN